MICWSLLDNVLTAEFLRCEVVSHKRFHKISLCAAASHMSPAWGGQLPLQGWINVVKVLMMWLRRDREEREEEEEEESPFSWWLVVPRVLTKRNIQGVMYKQGGDASHVIYMVIFQDSSTVFPLIITFMIFNYFYCNNSTSLWYVVSPWSFVKNLHIKCLLRLSIFHTKQYVARAFPFLVIYLFVDTLSNSSFTFTGITAWVIYLWKLKK